MRHVVLLELVAAEDPHLGNVGDEPEHCSLTALQEYLRGRGAGGPGQALAELLETTLLTLDRRIGRAPGVRCTIATPEEDEPELPGPS